MKEYNVYGKIIINVQLDIHAESEEEAQKKVLAELNHSYLLNVTGSYHDPKKDVEIELDVIEYETEDGGHFCPYCNHKSLQINDHFAHVELEHPGKSKF